MIQLIHHEDLRTLLADLLENALNAALKVKRKKLLLTIGSKDGIDTIRGFMTAARHFPKRYSQALACGLLLPAGSMEEAESG